jgi:hypothetical protein
MNPSMNGPAPAEDQAKLLEEALNVVKVQAHHMKKCLVSTSLKAFIYGMLDVQVHIACNIGQIFVLAALSWLMKFPLVNLTPIIIILKDIFAIY